MNSYRVPKVNSIHIIGKVINEPKFNITKTTNAMVVCFMVEWSEKYKIRNNETRERTCYVNVSAWLKLAEQCKEYLQKGDKVYVEGKLVTWNDHDEQGQLKSGIEILASKIDFLTIRKLQDESIPIQPIIIPEIEIFPKFNVIHIVGNLTSEPKFHVARTTNAMVSNFRIAWSEKFKIRNNDIRERSCYVNVSAWLKLAELCKRYLQKGDKVYVEGKLITWNDHNEQGQLKSGLEILANKIDFLTIKNGTTTISPDHSEIEPNHEITETLTDEQQQQ